MEEAWSSPSLLLTGASQEQCLPPGARRGHSFALTVAPQALRALGMRKQPLFCIYSTPGLHPVSNLSTPWALQERH